VHVQLGARSGRVGVTHSASSDVLRWRLVGRFLRWRYARTTLQLVLLLVASVLVLHGIFGPQVAPANLATVLSWVQYRGWLIIALLAAGNFFCTGCPFVLVRDTGRRLWTPSRRWPRGLRVKWIGIALFVAVLFIYELYDLWALPRATAWLVLGYFAVALAVDLVFTGATFCKYLCPIGQFSFVASTMSPLELQVKHADTCRTCRTVDCIKGRRDEAVPSRVLRRGCELALFLPAKAGNLDCTFCLDCVQACPHDNIAMATRVPGLELIDPRRRSGIGWLPRRRDVAVLAVVFVFGGLINALGMTAPARAAEQGLARILGAQSEGPVLAALFAIVLVIIPLVLMSAAAALTAWVTGQRISSALDVASRYSYALIPLGFGVWLAHYGFHLFTGVLTVIPVTQSAVVDFLGWAALGTPLWQLTGIRPGLVFPFEVGVILVGASGSLVVAYLISERDHGQRRVAATIPWVLVTVAVTIAALWITSQPMDMRAVGFPG
jgi:ferredoxin